MSPVSAFGRSSSSAVRCPKGNVRPEGEYMATALWVIYDIVLFLAGFLVLDRNLTQKEKVVIASLALVGLVMAAYSGYSDYEDSALISSIKEGQLYNTGQLDALAKLDATALNTLAAKSGTDPKAGANAVANAAASKIEKLTQELGAFEEREWPILKPETIANLAQLLSKAGKHQVNFSPCATHDCDLFQDGFRSAFSKAGWSGIPAPFYEIIAKAPPGWVISSFGDEAGANMLHDAIKAVLKADVPVLNYPKQQTGAFVEFKIGTKPLDLHLSQ